METTADTYLAERIAYASELADRAARRPGEPYKFGGRDAAADAGYTQHTPEGRAFAQVYDTVRCG